MQLPIYLSSQTYEQLSFAKPKEMTTPQFCALILKNAGIKYEETGAVPTEINNV